MEGFSEKHLTDIAGILTITDVNKEEFKQRLSSQAFEKYQAIPR